MYSIIIYSLILILLVLNISLLCKSANVACEDVCNCYHRRIGEKNDKRYYIIDCSNLGLDTFPSLFPLTSTHILLNGNNFQQVVSGDFGIAGRILPEIREIYLHNNPIESIDANTFVNCLRMHTLLLHHTSLTTIPSGLLTGMKYLKYFWVNDAALTSIPQGTFDGLTALIEVYLYSNDLSSLDKGMFKDSPKLRELLLHDNPSLPSPTCCDFCGIQEKAKISWGTWSSETQSTVDCGCDGTTTCADCSYTECTTYIISAASSIFSKYSYIIGIIAAISSSIFLLL